MFFRVVTLQNPVETANRSAGRPIVDERLLRVSEFTTVAKVGDIRENEGVAYAVNGRMVAVFREGDQYFAIDDFCPHMGASLAGGCVEQGIVACPWHAWRFRINDGTWCDNPRIKIDAFQVRVVDDQIQVCVPPKPERSM